MRLLAVLVIIASLSMVRCASSQSTADQDVTDASSPAAQDSVTDAAQDVAAADTSESDLNNPDLAAEQALLDDQAPPPAEQPPAPEVADTPTTPPAEQAAPVDGEATAQITGLDYNANMDGGTVIVKTSSPVRYTTRKTASNQFILELQNTEVPKKFQRPYNTKEFGGPIAFINAYQGKGAFKTARVVIQMRDGSEPGIIQDGSVIKLAAAGGTPGAPDQADAQAPIDGAPPEEASASDEQVADANGAQSTAQSLNNDSMNAFLTGNAKYFGKPISLEFKDTDIRDVFKMISEEVGVNIIAGDDVSGKVTLKLRKIPWDQALAVILQSKQLGYSKQGSILRIAPLKTLQAESDAARGVIEAQRQLLPLHVQLFPVSYAKSEELEAQVKDFLSPRGKAKADRRTNTLVVTDIDENLARIKTLVGRLDTQTPQVLIEAKVVEARESFSRLVGVNWGFTGAPINAGTTGSGNTVNFKPALNISPSSAAKAGALDLNLQLGTLDYFGDLTASLKLLEVESIVKVLSSPRIVTLDRVDAKIEQTTQFPIFNSTTDATGKPQTSVTFQDVKLQMTVKPQITADGGIIMDLNILREFADAPTESGSSQARAINKRAATTQVLVNNGDTIVIGGIYQSDVSESETGVPFLRKIPILGALFRSRNIARDKNELVIFLTPRVLNREKAFVKGGRG